MPSPPELPAELERIVLAHKSLNDKRESETWGNLDRLVVIGKRILPAAVMEVLARKKPHLGAVELETEVSKKLTYDSYDQWIDKYGIRGILYCTLEAKERLKEPDETDEIIHSWVGAVYLHRGLPAVTLWLGSDIDETFDASSAQQLADGHKRVKSNDTAPPPPIGTPPPLPTSGPSTTSLHPNPVSALNELTVKRNLTLSWNDEAAGPGHNLTWTVKCLWNNEVQTTATGKSKKEAKESAAKMALQKLGAC